MDLLASTNRFAVYFAFGMAWRPRPQPDGAWNIVAPSPPAEPARVIDVTPEPLAAATPRHSQPNLFQNPSTAPSYAPAAKPHQSASLVTQPRPLGLILDTWA